MKPNRRRSLGPFVGVLAALFALSLIAPRAWLRTSTPPAAVNTTEYYIPTETPIAPAATHSYAATSPHATIPQAAISQATIPQSTSPEFGPQLLVLDRAYSPPPPVFRVSAELADVSAEAPTSNDPADNQTGNDQTAAQTHSVWKPEIVPEVALRPSHPEPTPAEVMPALPSPNLPLAATPDLIETRAADPLAERLPKALLEQLETIAANPAAGAWGRAIAQRIHELVQQSAGGGATNARLLGELHRLAEQGTALAQQSPDPALAANIRRAQYALAKRLDIWERVYRGFLPTGPEAIAHATDHGRFAASVAHLESAPHTAQDGKPLREYLLLDALKNAARNETSDAAAVERRAIARRVLAKLNQLKLPSHPLTDRDDTALGALSDELRYWAAEAVSADQVLAQVERFEQDGDSENGKILATLARRLILSPDPKAQEVGQQIDQHYRNANLRIAISERLLNRLVPPSQTTAGDVQDVILGVPVSGCSTTTTQLKIKLVPDPSYLRMTIEAQGVVDSQTVSSSGPATFHTQGDSTYDARKLVRIGTDGIRVKHAAADANSNSGLQAMETNFDGVPLLSSLVRSIARSQYEKKQGEAKVEVEGKVASRAQEQIDAEVDARLAQAEKQFQAKVVNRLAKMELDPQISSLTTTEQRVVMRLRLAGEEQLAAYTPRPQAPGDSWASLQIHQSAINTGLLNLRLDGKTFTAQDLAVYLADRLGMPQIAAKKDELPDDVTVKFADRDAVMVRCQDGQLTISVAIAELTSGTNRFTNFAARVHYKPEPIGLQAGFARDGIIELIGERLNTKSQVALRGVLAKMFSRDKRLQLLPEKWLSDPRLKDLIVTQFVVEDGWIGLALSPAPAGTITKAPGKQDAGG